MFSTKHINRTTISGAFSRNVRKNFSYKHKFTASEDDGMNIEDIIAYSLIGLLFFALSCWLFGPDFMLPNGPCWSLTLIWVSSYVCGQLIAKMKLPALMGMLLSGIILKNLPFDPVQGLPDRWSSAIRAGGLAIILMRSGLELDLSAINRLGWVTIRLTALPGIFEAFVVSAAAVGIFDMSFPMGLSLGFILAAVSPAVVVVGMFDLQRRGYGIKKGIPSLVVAAASFDDVVAISGFSLVIGFAVTAGTESTDNSHSKIEDVIHMLHGVINIIGGALIGLLGGLLCSWTKIWNTHQKQTLAFLGWGLMSMFMCNHYHFVGAGSLGGLATGIFASNFWAKGTPKSISAGSDKHIAHVVESHLATIWSYFAQPCLFGVIGSAIDFRVLKLEIIPKALLVIFIGVMARLPMAALATGGKGLTFIERSFIALSWIPKATVQAALASVPLDMVKVSMEETHVDYEKYYDWGQVILTTSVFSIIVTAPIGLLVISKLGPKWLTYDGPGESEIQYKIQLEKQKKEEEHEDEIKKPRKRSLSQLVTADPQQENVDKEQNLRLFSLIQNDVQNLVDVLDNTALQQEEMRTQSKALVTNIHAGLRLADVVMMEKMPTYKSIDTVGNFFATLEGIDMNTPLTPPKSRNSQEPAYVINDPFI